MEHVGAVGTDPGDTATILGGHAGERSREPMDFAPGEFNAVQAPKRVGAAEPEDARKVADGAAGTVEDRVGVGGGKLLADGLAQVAYFARSGGVGLEVAFALIDGPEGRRLDIDQAAVRNAHQFERAPTDIEEAAVAEHGAVDDAKKAAEGLVVPGEDAHMEAGLFAGALDEVVSVRCATKASVATATVAGGEGRGPGP